ncbi:MAG: cbb3-type cytochrome c oxidase subunit II [Verrucomicrobiota bacterium]
MKSLRLFVIVLLAVFAAPWLFLIAIPFGKLKSSETVFYSAEHDIINDVPQDGPFPPGRRGMALRGAEIYARNGCAYCHTQMVRPTYAGSDMWRFGWGGREEDQTMRETLPQDFAGENYAHLGMARLGPDLANYGWRAENVQEVYAQLYAPQQQQLHSVMPAFHQLFKLRRIQGQRSNEALDVELDLEDAEDWEVVPTEDARALAAYLLSMKKDYPLPASLAGGSVIEREIEPEPMPESEVDSPAGTDAGGQSDT